MKSRADIKGNTIDAGDMVTVVNSSLVTYGLDGLVESVYDDGSVMVNFRKVANPFHAMNHIIRFRNTNSLSIKQKYDEQNTNKTSSKTNVGFSSTVIEDNTDKFSENPVMITFGSDSVFLKDYSTDGCEPLYTLIYLADSDKKKFKDMVVGSVVTEDELMDMGIETNYIPFRGKIVLEQ